MPRYRGVELHCLRGRPRVWAMAMSLGPAQTRRSRSASQRIIRRPASISPPSSTVSSRHGRHGRPGRRGGACVLLFQLVNGAAVSFAWSGAETLIAQLAEGDAGYIGKFSFFARLGSTTAPILAGMVWDFGGAWPAYLLGAAWGAVLTVALLRTPEAEIFGPRRQYGTGRVRFRARDALPRASDYISSIMLIAIPAIALSMAIMSMRNTTYSIQTSVYIVYLDHIGLVGTMIGILFASVEIASGFGSLFAGRAMRLGDPQRTMRSE